MLVKAKVKYVTIDNENKKRRVTATLSGRTSEELQGRIDKYINRLHINAERNGLQILMRN